MTNLSQTDTVFARLQALCKTHGYGFERVDISLHVDGRVCFEFHSSAATVAVYADLLAGGPYDLPNQALRTAFPDWSGE